METKRYSGWLVEQDWGEGMDVLWLKDGDEPIAQLIANDMDDHGPYLSVRYFVSDNEASLEQAQEAWLRTLFGASDANVGHAYSEFTGYLWTDEEINVGGHDLIAELHSHVGKYLNLEIEYSPSEVAAR